MSSTKRSRSRVRRLVTGAWATVLLASALATGAAASAGSWARGVEATLPADAAAKPGVVLNAVSCATAGNCAAVGTYYTTAGRNQGLLLSQAAGRWRTGLEASAPADAAPNHQVFLTGVSCGAPGDCAAIGSYNDSANNQLGLLLTESSGRWSAGVRAALPGGVASPFVSLPSVSCSSAGHCVAVGDYQDGSANEAVILTEAAGTWSAGIQAPLPGDAASPHFAHLTSVSCPSTGNCTAVGQYADASGRYQGLLLDERSGTWSAAVQAGMPAGVAANRRVDLSSVSCASAGNCTAVGTWDSFDNQNHAVVLTETAGTWSTGVEARPPAGDAGEPRLNVGPVSCGSAGHCTAVGAHIHFPYGFFLDQSAGGAITAVRPTPPAQAAQGTVNLRSVSCPSAGNCAAVGTYTDLRTSSGRGLLLSEVSGTWTRGIPALLPATPGTTGVVDLGSVSCASPGNCTAVGSYSSDDATVLRGLLLTQSTPRSRRAAKVHGVLRRSPNVRGGSATFEARRLDARRLRATFRLRVQVTHATTLRFDYSSCRATSHGPSCALESANRSSRPFRVRPGLRRLTYRATVAYPRSGQRTACVTAEVKDLDPHGARQYLLGPVGVRHTRVCPR